MSTIPVHVVTSFDPNTRETETAGGYVDLVAAKLQAAQHRAVLADVGITVDMFIEEWDDANFVAHRQLRGDEWFVSLGPTFAPIRED